MAVKKNKMKTHKVIDLIYHKNEGNEVYAGTEQECYDWIKEQGGYSFTYQVVPMTNEEINNHGKYTQGI
jgi:hypothetical protein